MRVHISVDGGPLGDLSVTRESIVESSSYDGLRLDLLHLIKECTDVVTRGYFPDHLPKGDK